MDLKINIPEKVVERIVRGIMDNYPEAGRGNGLACRGWKYKTLEFDFEDCETGKRYELTKPQLLKAFPLIFTDKWPKGLTQPPIRKDWESWDNWLCQCDASDFDAFVQLALLGRVIYG